MPFELIITPEALRVLAELDRSDPDRAARVRAALAKMQVDIKSKGLSTHEYKSVTGPNNEKVFEAYVENHTPNAYRIIWYYGPNRRQITVATVIPHPG
jgi:hypothetical protein